MLGFVPQQVHRQRAAEASAQDTDGEQALLRDPPPPRFCCNLVIGIQAETDKVQQDVDCYDESLHVCSLFFLKNVKSCDKRVNLLVVLLLVALLIVAGLDTGYRWSSIPVVLTWLGALGMIGTSVTGNFQQ